MSQQKISYQQTYRRLLIDMHIPDWDKLFLAEFNPKNIVKQAKASGASGVMVYFQSHLGLCNWPTVSGRQHSKFRGFDPMKLLVDELNHSKLGICGYYSTIFNNWAYNEHPEWRIIPASPAIMGPLPMHRYGLCCPNNPEYKAFVLSQATEILEGYAIDCLFFDMVWWPTVCLCKHCEARCQNELGIDIPNTIDWHDTNWSAFQSAREQWITEFASLLKDLTHETRASTKVYHNFALAMSNWSKGISFSSAAAHDFLGGDFYGGRDEQLVISKLMSNLSPLVINEFMTTVARSLVDHEQLQNYSQLGAKTFGALGCHSAFLMIAAIDPDGSLNPAIIDRISEVYKKSKQFEQYLGGKPIDDVAVYFSDYSKMNFNDNGTKLKRLNTGAKPDYPHFEAVKGACTKLSSAHIPFAVTTKQRIDRLDDYKVIILPNVLRMDEEEIVYFKRYVENGGKLYASRSTSLTLSSGRKLDDFALSDIFGCHFDSNNVGRIAYIQPISQLVKKAISPERYLGHRSSHDGNIGSVKLLKGAGKILATTCLPYGFPETGRCDDSNWASIHSDPPWTSLENPTIVKNRYGNGVCIFSAMDIEAEESDACNQLFIRLIRDLLGQKASFESDAHPQVWMTLYHQQDNNRLIVSLLNYQLESPPLPIFDLDMNLSIPAGKTINRVFDVANQNNVSFRLDSDLRIYLQLKKLSDFAMIIVEYG